ERFSVRVSNVADSVLMEIVNVAGKEDLRRVDLNQVRFSSGQLAAGRTLLEFAPYAVTVDAMKPPYTTRYGTGYPVGAANMGDWQVTITRVAETVTVPAGKFQAQHFILKGTRRPPYVLDPARFEVGAWYAQEAKRYLRTEHKVWNVASTLLAD